MENNRICGTLCLFFEIWRSEMFGEVGYSEIKTDFKTSNFSNFDLQVFAQENVRRVAEICKVPEKNIRVISREEYEKNTEEE